MHIELRKSICYQNQENQCSQPHKHFRVHRSRFQSFHLQSKNSNPDNQTKQTMSLYCSSRKRKRGRGRHNRRAAICNTVNAPVIFPKISRMQWRCRRAWIPYVPAIFWKRRKKDSRFYTLH